jgi:hypothetical protein
MKLKPTLAAIAILISLLTTAARSQSEKSEGREFAGTYLYYFAFGGSKFELRADGTYQEDSSSCTFTTQESGTYVYSDGKLSFKISKYTGRQNGDRKEVDLFDAKLRSEFFGSPNDGKDSPMKTEYVLYPIKWGERMYLIYESGLGEFTDAVNLGIEPRDDNQQYDYYGTFLLRDGDEAKKTKGVPSLPAQYKERLLAEPITATIVSVETVGKEQFAIIDKGRLAGVKVGTKFLTKDEKPAPWSKGGIVLSVEDTSARLQVSEAVVGEVLTTKYERKDRFQ